MLALQLPGGNRALLVVDFEGLVGDEQDRHVMLGASPVFHRRAFREPDEMARSIVAVMGNEGPF